MLAKKQSRRLFYALVGGLLVAASASMWTLRDEGATARAVADEIRLSLDEGLMAGPLQVVLAPSVEFPPKVHIGEAFRVVVNFVIADVRYSDGRDARTSVPVSASDSYQLIKREVPRGMKVSLLLAGATVVPEKPQLVDGSMTAAWSVNVPSTGTHTGILRTEIDYEHGTLPGFGLFPAVDRDTSFKLAVSARPQSFQNALTIIGIILGTLLSITNLVAFSWQWRERLAAKAEEEKAIIIKP